MIRSETLTKLSRVCVEVSLCRFMVPIRVRSWKGKLPRRREGRARRSARAARWFPGAERRARSDMPDPLPLVHGPDAHSKFGGLSLFTLFLKLAGGKSPSNIRYEPSCALSGRSIDPGAGAGPVSGRFLPGSTLSKLAKLGAVHSRGQWCD